MTRQIWKAAVLCVLVLQLAFPRIPAIANIHPLAGISDKDETTGIQELDITMSLDWDPATVTGAEADPRGLTKAELEAAIKSYARSVFGMTNGLHRIRNVYVFPKKGYWDMANVRYISQTAGTSAANVSAWKKKQGDINMYVYETFADGVWTKDDSPGPVLAHECGHYIYGVFDEYKDYGTKAKTIAELEEENDLGTPAKDDDGTQQSIMNEHATYPNWFSVESGYSTDALKNTAQYRMFEDSIWNILAGDPAKDHENARDYRRTWFDAFKDISVTKAADRTAHQKNALTGYDASFEVVWMDTTAYHILVLDNNASAANWEKSLNAAAAAIRAATVGNWVSVLVGNRIEINRTQLTVANKAILINQVSSLNRGVSVSVEKSLEAALVQVGKYKTETAQEATYFVHLLTAGNPAVPSPLKKAFADARAMLNVASAAKGAGVAPAAGMITVADLAEVSGGKSKVASRSQTMDAQFARDIGLLEGDNTADIAAAAYSGPLATGNSQTMTFRVGPRDDIVTVSFFAAEDEWNKVQPSLTDPAGQVRKEGSLAAGVTLEKDQDTGLWLFTIDRSLYAGGLGTWSATMTALAPTEGSLEIVASAESNLALRIDVQESPLFGYVATAFLTADRPILNARVTADIYNLDGDLLETLTLKDDGLNGDVKAGDGIYSARIRTPPSDDEFTIVAQADDNGGLARESDRKMVFISNDYVNETATGAFQRTDESAFQMSLSSGSGGRCFIAEAAWGTYLDAHVSALRSFRDRWLLPFGPGRTLVRFYYAHSPDWAAFIRKHKTARHLVRAVLTPVVYSVQYPLLPLGAVLIGIGFSKRKRWMPAVRGVFERDRA
ncbi:MAG: hypothetical protein M0009_08975 [Deltaproteobacteria bacterium]|nr:hypothetical protein [Deltaproteobacteria bacterium]